MKLIDNILNDYFSKALINEVLYKIRIRNYVDTKIEIEKGKKKSWTNIRIMCKPKYYKYYTPIYTFHKKDSFNHLTTLKCAREDYITDRIRKLDENDSWYKGINRKD